MSNDNKTLADVQPGGRVRLGDQAERARFEQYRGVDFELDSQGYYANPRTAQDWAIWQAALSAQPSPGGQDAHEMADALERIASGSLSDYEGVDADELHILRCAKLIRDLAARQPVGEPFAYTRANTVVDPLPVITPAEYAGLREQGLGERFRALLFSDAAPPAQAVDLEELRRAACVVNVVGQIDGHDVVRRNSVLDVIDNRRQRLVDSQAVGNG